MVASLVHVIQLSVSYDNGKGSLVLDIEPLVALPMHN